MAAVTGGRYLHNTNDLTMGFKQTVKDMQASYTLGFYTPDDPDDKWHKLKIRVKGNGLNARYREGYLADSGSGPTGGMDSGNVAHGVHQPGRIDGDSADGEVRNYRFGRTGADAVRGCQCAQFRNGREQSQG